VRAERHGAGDCAVRQLRAQGTMVPDDLLAHVVPLGWEHISLTGDYVRIEANPAAPFRSLREVRSKFQPWRPSVF
jgi:hypothetical protein